MRSTQSGSVAASVLAMLASALAFWRWSVMAWAMRSASAMRRAERPGSMMASVLAMLANAIALRRWSRRIEEEHRREEERQRRARSSKSQLLGPLADTFRIADSFASDLRFAERAVNLSNGPDYSLIPRTLALRPPSAELIDANRLDNLVEATVRASQRVEDLQEELRRLRQQHADAVKPDALLWWALVILTAYAIVGVAMPLWVMSDGPASLSAVRWTFWPFAAGLAAPIAYIA